MATASWKLAESQETLVTPRGHEQALPVATSDIRQTFTVFKNNSALSQFTNIADSQPARTCGEMERPPLPKAGEGRSPAEKLLGAGDSLCRRFWHIVGVNT